MDLGLDIFAGIFTGILDALLELVIWLLELLFYLVETVICGVVWLFKYSKSNAGAPRWRKLPERSRFFIQSCMHTTLALGLVFSLVYVGWLRKPAPQPPPPTKIEKAQKVIEKAKRIKEALLPPKPQP